MGFTLTPPEHQKIQWTGILVIDCHHPVLAPTEKEIKAILNATANNLDHECPRHIKGERIRIALDVAISRTQFEDMLQRLTRAVNPKLMAWVCTETSDLGYLDFGFPNWVSEEARVQFKREYVAAMVRNLQWSEHHDMVELDNVWEDQP